MTILFFKKDNAENEKKVIILQLLDVVKSILPLRRIYIRLVTDACSVR